MRSERVGLIARKELLDTLRDRRTLFVALILPLLLYPALLLGLTQVIGATKRNLQEEKQRVLVDGLDADPELAEALEEGLELKTLDNAAEMRATLRIIADSIADVDEDTPAEDIDAWRREMRGILAQNDVVGVLFARLEGGAEVPAARNEAMLLFDATNDESRAARRKVRAALHEYSERERERAKELYSDQRPLLEFMVHPIDVSTVEVASSQQKGAYSFAPMLALLIVLMCLTGAFYPAVDLVAGEKERGTMETLLVAPVTRTDIVLGKFLAVWVVAVVTALLNLGVMGLTFSKLAGMMPGSGIAFTMPAGALAAVTLILIPTAALFAAVALAASSFATSYKEGQHYLSPIFLVVMPLAMVAMLPNVELGPTLALVPVANVVLLVKAMLLGGEGARWALVAILAMAFYAALALWVTVSLFKRESVLFRSGAGKGHDATSLEAKRLGLPTESQGVLVFFVVLAFMFFLSGGTLPTDLWGVAKIFLISQVVAVLLPTLLAARFMKVDLKRTFRIAPLAPAAVPAIMCGALSTLVLVVGAQMRLMPAPEAEGFTQVVGMLAKAPVAVMLLLLAVLPPVCEELLCRGFLLSSLKTRFGAVRAVALTALLFGLLHLDASRIPATAAAGVVLGTVAILTRSIFGSILFHSVYNAVLALALHFPDLARGLENLGGIAFALAGVGLTLSLWFLHRLARPSESDGDSIAPPVP